MFEQIIISAQQIIQIQGPFWLLALITLIACFFVGWLLQRQRRQLEETALQRAAQAEKLIAELIRDEANRSSKVLRDEISDSRETQIRALQDLRDGFGQLQTKMEQRLAEFSQQQNKHQNDALIQLEKALRDTGKSTADQLSATLNARLEDVQNRVTQLTSSTDKRLQEIGGQVEKRLSEGFEKTTSTFTEVQKRLTQIDEAQKRITELSSNVVSLQQILSDKRSRGAFGEVQLAALVSNVLPDSAYALQHPLSNGKRVDCMLFLPEPTGHVSVDSKFPLESFQISSDPDRSDIERQQAARQFGQDVKKHINDIADRYIIERETAPGAIMFVPAEALFAEIHGRYPELVALAQQRNVWIASPATLMAILTTAAAVLKDEATRKQVHIIQDHLRELNKDFSRFQERMDKLSRHIGQAHQDVEQVHVSARKISSRFQKIERVELDDDDAEENLEALQKN